MNRIFFTGMAAFVLLSLFVSGQNKSSIVLYRENIYQGSVVTYKINVNDTLLIRLKNASFYTFDAAPGDYTFRINKSGQPDLTLKVEEDRTYYIRMGLKMTFWSSVPELILVDSVSALPVIRSGALKELDGSNIPVDRPDHRVGVSLGIGFGFENFPMFTTVDGDDSKISFGGGFGAGIRYGYEFSRHFDLAVEAIYQSSGLRPYLKNASTSFNRFIISVTPSYIIPIDGGDAMRIKLGAGPDLYLSPELKIKGSKVTGGFDDNWSYGGTAGFHVTGIFEMNPSEKWSVIYGLKYYNAAYKFESGGGYAPMDNQLRTPDGSGIDILFGFNYHF